MNLAELTKPQDINVLLIEDSPGDASAISKAVMLGETLYSFRITRKDSLTDGVRYLDSRSLSEVDVVLLDLNLPDAKELRAIDELHGLYPELPIVVVSGYSDMDIVHQALHKGAQEFLIKGECSGVHIRQSIYQAIARKKIEGDYKSGERL